MKWITGVLLNWVALMIVAGITGDHFYISGYAIAFLAAIILSLMNGIVRPILVFFTLPITVLSFGLFLLVINAVTLMFTAALIEGFHIDGFLSAFVAGIFISILNFVLQNFVIGHLKK